MVAGNPHVEAAAAELLGRYRLIRGRTEALAAPLSAEDQQIQSMPDASPTKWHRGHTTWFFETFVLKPSVEGYRSFDPRYGYLFNSYYEALGERHERPRRGLLSRPSLDEVRAYRRHVDGALEAFLESREPAGAVAEIVELGLNHEEQHQELILTDIKHALGTNPLRPAYSENPAPAASTAPVARWLGFAGGVVEVGYAGPGFAFDNEGPRHRVFLGPYELASRLVTAGEYLAFMADRGYERPELWLSDGWSAVRSNAWRAPEHWREKDATWRQYTLAGERPVDPAEPICHVSYYEADAYARWAGARLPTEPEWEHATAAVPNAVVTGNLLEDGALHPRPAGASTEHAAQLFGDVWEWTQSAYAPYPGFRPAAGAVGEYNGKFMVNQLVLRGGSCFTPRSHIRASYRNFFPPSVRWQMSGLRLARDR